MRQAILSTYGEFLARRRWSVLFGSLLLSAGSASTLPFLKVLSSREGLSSPDDPQENRFDRYLEDTGPNRVGVVVDGGTEAERRAFVDEFAARLQGRKDIVGEVSYRLPLEFFREHALAFVPLPELAKASVALERESATLTALAEAKGLADLHRMAAERIRKEMQAGGRFDPKTAGEAAAVLKIVLQFARAERRLSEKPAEAAAELERIDVFSLATRAVPSEERLAIFAHGGYIASADGSLYVAEVQPAKRKQKGEELEKLIAALREAGEAARAGRPDVQFTLAGLPVVEVEEAQTVKRDGRLCGAVAVIGVGLLAAIAFRRKVAVLLVLFALALGILWDAGLTWLIFGQINQIALAVPVILLALGIDFAIHTVAAYEAERALGRSRFDAIAVAVPRVGPGLLTGAATTALAFYSICFMEYRGFQEFGIIAGNGVLSCLAAMTTVLPALLVITDRRQAPPPPARVAPLVEEIVAEPPDLPPPGSPVRPAWHAVCRATTAFPLASVLVGAGVTAYFLVLARGIGFDFRVEDLLPENAESIRAEKKLSRHPEVSPEFAVISARSLDELAALQEKARTTPGLGKLESILDLLPPEPERRQALIAQIRRLLDPVRIDPARLAPVDAAAVRASLESLAEVFSGALDRLTAATGAQEMRRTLDEIVNTFYASAEAVASEPPGWAAAFGAAQEKLWRWAAERKAELDRMLQAPVPHEADLPPVILKELKGSVSGLYYLRVHPAESIEERENLRKFIEAVRSVSTEATGYPIVFYSSTELIHRGFSRAVGAAAVVIFLTLLLDFRRLDRVALATLPKVVGIIWMLGIMRLLGINYNLANQIVIPLIIGVGLAYGIHVIHRFFAEEPGRRNITKVLEHTGAAIALSGLTTMIGFGSLALASYRGMASMGIVLFFGVGAALVASTYFLANLLYVIYRPKR